MKCELEKAGSERRQRKTAVRQAFAEYGDRRRGARPKGSGLATVRAKACPKAGLSGAEGKTVAAPAAGTGILRKTEALFKKVARPSPQFTQADNKPEGFGCFICRL